MLRKGERTREALTLSAVRLIAEHGPDAFELRDVARGAGQHNNSVVQYHFRPAFEGDTSRKALVRAAVQRAIELPVDDIVRKVFALRCLTSRSLGALMLSSDLGERLWRPYGAHPKVAVAELYGAECGLDDLTDWVEASVTIVLDSAEAFTVRHWASRPEATPADVEIAALALLHEKLNPEPWVDPDAAALSGDAATEGRPETELVG